MAAVAAQELMVERPEIFAGLGRRPHLVTLSAPLDVAHKQDGAHPLVVKLGGLMRRGVGQIEPGLEPLAEARSRRIRMVNVSSDADGLIYPNSAALDGVPSVRLRHATHMTMGFDPVAITTAIQALAGGVPAAPAPGR